MTPEQYAAADAAANVVADAARRPLDLSQIWSYRRLPDLRMEDEAAIAAKAAADAAEAADQAKREARLGSVTDERIKRLAKDSPENFDYMYDLRESDSRNRKKVRELESEKDALAAENARIKSIAEDAEKAKLAENNEHKELYERESKARANTRAKLVDTKIEAQVAKRGYTEEGEKRAMKLIERKGIEVDSDDNVSGVQKAFDRMEEEWGEEMFKAPKSNEGGSGGDDGDKDKTKNPRQQKDDDDDESAAELKRRKALGDAGKELPPAKTKKPTSKFDARDPKTTPEERAARLMEIRRG